MWHTRFQNNCPNNCSIPKYDSTFFYHCHSHWIFQSLQKTYVTWRKDHMLLKRCKSTFQIVICFCLWMCTVCIPKWVSRGQRTTLWRWFFYLCAGSRDWTQVSSLVWQGFLTVKSSRQSKKLVLRNNLVTCLWWWIIISEIDFLDLCIYYITGVLYTSVYIPLVIFNFTYGSLIK